MKEIKYLHDLVVLVADRNMEYSIRSLLERSESLEIKPIDCEIFPHPKRDPGCLHKGHDFLLKFATTHRYALVVFDREGCGKETLLTREELETEVEKNLSLSGWGNRAVAIVIDPELENWLWSDSSEVDVALGWQGKTPDLRTWLKQKGFLTEDATKPFPPKNAVESALELVNKPRSSSIYSQIAKKVSLRRCQDEAFLKLKNTLRQWFAQG